MDNKPHLVENRPSEIFGPSDNLKGGNYISRKRKHKRSAKKNSFKIFSGSFGTFLVKYIFHIFGYGLFIAGIAWLLISFLSIKSLDHLIQLLSGEGRMVSQEALSPYAIKISTLINLIPGISLLLIALLFKFVFKLAIKFANIFYYLGFVLTFVVFIYEILHGNFMPGAYAFSTSIVASLSTLVLIAPFIAYSSFLPTKRIQFAIIFLFYLSVLIFSATYTGPSFALLFLVIFFAVLLYFFSGQSLGSTITTFNAYLALAYFSLYSLRKLISKSNPDLVWPFIGFLTILFVVILAIQVLKSYQGTNKVKKHFHKSIIFGANAFYFLFVSYLLRKYQLESSQWVIAVLLVVVNYSIILFSKFYFPHHNRIPYYLTAILFASSIIPLLLRQSEYVLFSSIASVSLILFAKARKYPFVALLSLGAGSLSVIALLVEFQFVATPAVFINTESVLLQFRPFILFLLIGSIVPFTISYVYKDFSRINFNYSDKWFSKSKSLLSLHVLFYFSIYIIGFWVFQYVYFYFFNVPKAKVLSWYFFHIVFVLLWLYIISSKHKGLIKQYLWLSLGSLIMFPFFINFYLISLRNDALADIVSANWCFGFHLISIIPIFFLTLSLASSFESAYHRIKSISTYAWVFRLSMLSYLLAAIYDHISIYFGATDGLGDGILAFNRTIPYSLILFACSFLLLLISFGKNDKKLRLISMLLLLVSIIKVFGYDFIAMNTTIQALTFWFVGGFLIAYSSVYQRLRRKIIKSNIETKKQRSTDTKRIFSESFDNKNNTN